MWILAITATLVAIIVLFINPFTPIQTAGKSKFHLGDGRYDMAPATAPVATGFFLEAIAYIFSKTIFGPSIIRMLLDDNKVEDIRELAAQIHLPPMYFPMRRLSPSEKEQYLQEMESEAIDSIINFGITDPIQPTSGNLKTIEDYAAVYRQGIVKPSTIMQQTLQTIRDWEKKGFHIFSMVRDEAVLEQARQSDERFRLGKPLSILDGVPVAFKDTVDIIDHIVYSGQNPKPEFDQFVRRAKQDDIIVRRFRELGAIIVGLTIMIEGGTTAVGYSAHFQGPLSAFSRNRYPGGSSSGSAVAVATGLVPMAVGFDGGGSVRLPATMSGVHGLATGFARCPFDMDVDSTLIKSGPIAASSADVAIAYAVMCRSEPSHFYSKLYDGGVEGPPPIHLTGYHHIYDLTDVRLGIFPEYFNHSDGHIRDRTYQALAFLKSRGATLVEIQIPHLRAANLAHGLKIGTEFTQGFEKAYHARPSG